MNYLAHSYLAFGHEEHITGQFIADDIKGKKYLEYSPGIQHGILTHRFVDSFTDQHPVCHELRALLRPKLGLYSGVALDVIFDHLLASQWERHHEDELPFYIENVYSTLHRNSGIMSEKMQFILGKMIEHNWLGRYPSTEGIILTMRQMASRVPAGTVLLESPEILDRHRKTFDEAFDVFFPELISATQAKLNTFATC